MNSERCLSPCSFIQDITPWEREKLVQQSIAVFETAVRGITPAALCKLQYSVSCYMHLLLTDFMSVNTALFCSSAQSLFIHSFLSLVPGFNLIWESVI